VEVRPGYKRTEVGVIPKEWEVSSLQQACREPITYGIVQCGPHVRDGVPYIRVSDMDVPELVTDEMLRTSGSIAAKFARSTVEEGDLVYALRGKLGEVRLVHGSVAGANLTQGTARLSPSAHVASDYFVWAMRDPRTVRQAELEAKGTTFREITLADLRRIRLLVPPILEQRAIAAALDDMDSLLRGMDRLIAKKRDLKRAAMQQLLTGQTRLPGFGGEWGVKRLGELAEIVSGGTPRTNVPSYWNGGVKWCTPTDVTRYAGKYLIETERTISRAGLEQSGAVLLPAGTLLLCSRATIGELKIAGVPVTTNQGFKSLVCRPPVSNEFLYYMLLTMKQQIIGRAFGSTFLEISTRSVAALEIAIPALDEQTAIATVLSDMGAELAALEARENKTRALKQAMMQELLTGRTRLVPAGGPDA
jgi:type I restriction enzyme, S subunit